MCPPAFYRKEADFMKNRIFCADAEEKEIRSFLSEEAQKVRITVVKETGSTNDDLKKAAVNGEKEFSVLIAEKQTKGKGRKGRSFYSPDGTGCYMSILLRPDCSLEESTLLTTMAAAATAEAVEKVTGISARIKWVNDIFIGGRKVAGILTEGSLAKYKKSLDWAVIGIGVNISPPKDGFPDELSEIAGALTKSGGEKIKNRLIAEIINCLTENYSRLSEKSYIRQYRSRLFFLGQEITVIEGDKSYSATALDIDSMCHLIVSLPDGTRKVLYGGEIGIKTDS